MKTIRHIQVFGERCSGTNYLEHLLVRNLKSIEITRGFGWKHGFWLDTKENPEEALLVVIYRNPFDWLRSFHKNAWHTSKELRISDFSDFIRKEWSCIYDEHSNTSPEDPLYGTEMLWERNPETDERYANVIEMRTTKIRHWESLRERTDNIIYVRLEDLSIEPENFIYRISEKFGLKKTLFFKKVTGYKGTNRKYRPKAYDQIKRDDLNYILNKLDIDLEEDIGYDIKTLLSNTFVP